MSKGTSDHRLMEMPDGQFEAMKKLHVELKAKGDAGDFAYQLAAKSLESHLEELKAQAND